MAAYGLKQVLHLTVIHLKVSNVYNCNTIRYVVRSLSPITTTSTMLK